MTKWSEEWIREHIRTNDTFHDIVESAADAILWEKEGISFCDIDEIKLKGDMIFVYGNSDIDNEGTTAVSFPVKYIINTIVDKENLLHWWQTKGCII